MMILPFELNKQLCGRDMIVARIKNSYIGETNIKYNCRKKLIIFWDPCFLTFFDLVRLPFVTLTMRFIVV